MHNNVSVLKSLAATDGHLEGKMPAASAARDATETLAACDEGYWAIVPFSFEQDMAGVIYPIYLVSVIALGDWRCD